LAVYRVLVESLEPKIRDYWRDLLSRCGHALALFALDGSARIGSTRYSYFAHEGNVVYSRRHVGHYAAARSARTLTLLVLQLFIPLHQLSCQPPAQRVLYARCTFPPSWLEVLGG
jgi:hypothetical protein